MDRAVPPSMATLAYADPLHAFATAASPHISKFDLLDAGVDGAGINPDAQQLHQQLQAARDRLVALESERRRLIDTSLSALALRSPTDSAQASGVQSPASGTYPAAFTEVSSKAVERPPWLMADGRFLTACLEGENRALKRAVSRARTEIDELMKRRGAAEARAQALAAENQAAAAALRRCALSSGACSPSQPQAQRQTPGHRPGEAPQGGQAEAAGGQHLADGAAAAVSLRRLVLQRHDGQVAESPAPAQPVLAQPVLAQPALAQPAPAQAVPALAAPAQAVPAQLAPAQPAPAQPALAQPAPAQAAPALAAPVQPVPEQSQLVPPQPAPASEVSPPPPAQAQHELGVGGGEAEDPPAEPASTTAGRGPAEALVVQQARSHLLETSAEIGRRMEEILSRRGKLQAARLQAAAHADSETADTGSLATSGESAEGSAQA